MYVSTFYAIVKDKQNNEEERTYIVSHIKVNSAFITSLHLPAEPLHPQALIRQLWGQEGGREGVEWDAEWEERGWDGKRPGMG